MSEKQRPNTNEPKGINKTPFAGLENNIFEEIFNKTWDNLTPENITLEALESRV